MEVSLEAETTAPLSQTSQELSRSYKEQKKKLFGYFKSRSALQQLNDQRAADQVTHVNNTRNRVKDNKNFLNTLALKITLHKLRIKELIEEYFQELDQLSPENQEEVMSYLIHSKILIIEEDLE